jgi:single-strand DNA-binding protein
VAKYDFNQMTASGNMVAEPELKNNENGAYARFTIANNQGEKTNFINCVAFKNTAEFVNKYFKKGNPILVTGQIDISDYTDKDGNKRTGISVRVHNVFFMGGKKDESDNGSWP